MVEQSGALSGGGGGGGGCTSSEGYFYVGNYRDVIESSVVDGGGRRFEAG